jgi:GcrA cell cycle regulator
MTGRAPPVFIPASTPARTCRWIDGDVRDPGWRYCDRPSVPGRSWCLEHNARAYRRGGANEGEG